MGPKCLQSSLVKNNMHSLGRSLFGFCGKKANLRDRQKRIRGIGRRGEIRGDVIEVGMAVTSSSRQAAHTTGICSLCAIALAQSPSYGNVP